MADEQTPLKPLGAPDNGAATPAEGDAAGLEPIDLEATEIDPEFYANGGVVFSEAEMHALGDVDGKRVLVLECGTGEEALSLFNLGARVAAVDTGEALERAQELATAAGVGIDFVENDGAAVPDELRDGSFDAVYSGFGVISWLDNIADWAADISGALKTGGRLVIYDEHPFGFVFEEEGGALAPANSYFGPWTDVDEEGMGDSGEMLDELEDDEGGEGESMETAAATVEMDEDEDVDEDEDEESDMSWTLGDLISALGSVGLATIELQEFPESDRFETALDRFAEMEGEPARNVPAVLVLTAIKVV
ncbi:MAG: class I SAM-dependent methyltransferase [Chloroflexi bacterium]|nr:class I SAM-dependent methyltransferase [Chloroflexota bacterium]